jgi:aminopeptidase N
LRIIQRLWPNAGGLSPASFIVLNELPRTPDGKPSETLVMNPYSPVDLAQWKEYFLAHEIAHQWWGQGVTWATYRDQWLSEGLAQYSSVLYLQAGHEGGAFSSILKKFSRWTRKKARWGPITLGSRLSVLDFEAYQAIVYDKTSLVLNMLRDLLGDELFFAGLREFFDRYRYSATTTGHFKSVMEQISGRNLAGFFSGWFDSHLLPDVRVSYVVQEKEAGTVLRVKVDQLDDVFVFPLWLEWTEASGGPLHRERLIIEKKTQEFELPLPVRPQKIGINPDEAVPGRLVLSKG